jgi:hypothetical protein
MKLLIFLFTARESLYLRKREVIFYFLGYKYKNHAFFFYYSGSESLPAELHVINFKIIA